MDMKIVGMQAPGSTETVTDIMQPIMGMSPEEFMKLTRSVLIVIPHRAGEGICGDLAQTIGFWAVNGTPVATVADPFGGFIELTRAGIVKTFMQYCSDHPEVDKLVMIDSDERVEWDAPYRLAMWDLPVVSGVVCTANQLRGVFACFTVKDKYGQARFPSYNFSKTIPSRGLLEAHSVGTGLICVKKSVFQAIYDSGKTPFIIPEAIREQSIESGILKWGEDISFCRQAEDLGFKRYVDLSVHATHFKTLAVDWPKHAIDSNIDVRDWRVDDRDYAHG